MAPATFALKLPGTPLKFYTLKETDLQIYISSQTSSVTTFTEHVFLKCKNFRHPVGSPGDNLVVLNSKLALCCFPGVLCKTRLQLRELFLEASLHVRIATNLQLSLQSACMHGNTEDFSYGFLRLPVHTLRSKRSTPLILFLTDGNFPALLFLSGSALGPLRNE